MASADNSDLKGKLLQPSFAPKAPDAKRLSDPIEDTPMVVTLEQLRPYEHNPRATRNPKYIELRDSIRSRGLDQPPPITRRPDEDHFIIRNGGNTRLAILNELYRETRDERFFRINCLFRPWDVTRGEIVSLTGHLAENDLHGQLMFIERAIAIEKARELYEQETGASLSQRELARRLSADGYPISQPHISKMQDAIRLLLPSAPNLMYTGLGKPQVEKMLSLRKAAQAAWDSVEDKKDNTVLDFPSLFQDVLAMFDGDAVEFFFERFQDELIGQLKGILGLGYEQTLLAITQYQDHQRRFNTPPDLPFEALIQPEIIIPQPHLPASMQPDPTPRPLVPAAPPGWEPDPEDAKFVSILDRDRTAATSREAAAQQPSQAILSAPSLSEAGGSLAANDAGLPTAPKPAPQYTPPPTAQLSDEECQARIDAHIVTPTGLTERVLKMKQQVAALDGEILPDFGANALTAIPVQAGGLHPISDLWYIEGEIDTPNSLREHILELAHEVLESVGAPGAVQRVPGGIGFKYCPPEADVEVSDTALHILTLLQSLNGSMAIALGMLQQQPQSHQEGTSGMAGLEFAAGLGRVLLGQPLTQEHQPDNAGRISDGALVKLFRLIRLARRLIDLEKQFLEQDEPSPKPNH
ncbi:transcriptional regulator [Pseudomonas protegens]|uniref:Transcriptional regulator n=1 Tax=Pseudomonas protegens TaxID=380021 RepID=A0A2T6GB49_9PSED|nr:ParB family protein [Pseudomonas protegens]PUA41374.1 transcriptional regulator [Pseudomonas protegens]